MPQVAGTSFDSSELAIHPTMHFRAVIAGWLVASGIAILLYVGGMALGFSSFNAWDAETSAKSMGIGTAIWVALTWVTSLLLGGLFSSWFNAHDDQTTGTLYGITVWGLSVTTTGLWIAMGLAHAMHGQPGGMGGMKGPHGMGAPTATLSGNGAVAVLNADIATRLSGRDRAASDQVVAALLAGKDAVASDLLAADMSTTSASAAQIVNELAPRISAARDDAKATAEQAAHHAAAALWMFFISAFLALIAAALGGWLGAGHIHRVYHLRKYPVRGSRV